MGGVDYYIKPALSPKATPPKDGRLWRRRGESLAEGKNLFPSMLYGIMGLKVSGLFRTEEARPELEQRLGAQLPAGHLVVA